MEDNEARKRHHPVLCHRVVGINTFNQTMYFVTKGDSNEHDDRRLFSKSTHRQFGLERHHLIGKIQARLPYLGMPVLMIRETHWGKVSLICM